MSATLPHHKTAPDADEQNAEQNVQTDRYGVPTAAYEALAGAHENYVAVCDHRDALFEDPHIIQTLAYPEDLPEDPLGVYRDVQTGQLVEVGRNETQGWFVSRDFETHDEAFVPGEIIPAIESRRLVPVTKDDDGELHEIMPEARTAVMG